MTEVQNFMLVVCFGCTIGFLIGTFSIMVSDGIHYLKKRMRMKKEQKEQNTVEWGESAKIYTPLFAIVYASFFKYIKLPDEVIKSTLLQIF